MIDQVVKKILKIVLMSVVFVPTLVSKVRFGNIQSSIEATSAAKIVVATPVFNVTNGTVGLGKLSGTVNFKSAQCNNFDIDSTNATTIALNGDTFLSQVNSPVTLKSIDALTVTGQNNILEINNQFTFSGSLILAANSQLIIKFSKDAQIPSMYFNTATPIVIGNGSLLEFQGMGPVQCANGVRFVLTPSTNSNPVTTLAVSDAALLTIDNGGTVVISGQGAINCSDYAGFKLINPSQLKFGAANNDKLALSLNRNAIMSALVNKGIVNSSSNAYISFAQGGYSLDIAAGSILQAGLQGVIEFNLNKGVVSSSNCTAMTFGLESVIQSDLGGKIAFAPNSTGNLTPLLAWNSIGANFKGTGLVQLYDKTTRALTLMGQLSLLSVAVNFKNNFVTMRQIVRQLVQTVAGLQSTVVYINQNGKTIVRTLNDKEITLTTGQMVVQDDAQGNFVVQDSLLGKYIKYDALGKKLS